MAITSKTVRDFQALVRLVCVMALLGALAGAGLGWKFESSRLPEAEREVLGIYATGAGLDALGARLPPGWGALRPIEFVRGVREDYPTSAARLDQAIWRVLVFPWSALGVFAGWVLLWLFGRLLAVIQGATSATRRGGKHHSDAFLRGTRIIHDREAVARLKQDGKTSHAVIGRVPIPLDVEPTHFLMAGAPGSGKSLAFFQLLDSARARGHRVLVADVGGEFVRRYYRPGRDAILNPFDRRTEHWSPFAEMERLYDAARVAASLIPEGQGESKEWNGYARAMLEGLLERLWEIGQTTNEKLVGYALAGETKQLRELLAGTPAAVYFAEGNERQLGSIRGILASYIKPLTYLRAQVGTNGFSTRSWVQGEGDGWLFVTTRKDQLDSLRVMLGAQVDQAAVAILSSDSQLSRRLWFALDEFAQLGEIRQLEPLLNLGRKFGVCAILGMQGTTQPAMVYGRERAQAILAGIGTWTVFRQAEAESAEYMSRLLGDQEIRRNVASKNWGVDNTSTGTSEQVVRHRAVMPGELMQLEPRQAIVNLAGAMPPAVTLIPLPVAAAPRRDEPVGIEEAPNYRPMTIRRPGADPACFEV